MGAPTRTAPWRRASGAQLTAEAAPSSLPRDTISGTHVGAPSWRARTRGARGPYHEASYLDASLAPSWRAQLTAEYAPSWRQDARRPAHCRSGARGAQLARQDARRQGPLP